MTEAEVDALFAQAEPEVVAAQEVHDEKVDTVDIVDMYGEWVTTVPIVPLKKRPDPLEYLATVESGGYTWNIWPRRSLIEITGQKKSGKSQLASIITATLIGETQFKIKAVKPGYRILIADTEQDQSEIYEEVERAFHLAGREMVDHPDVLALGLRTVPEKDEKWKALETTMNNFKPDVVLLDGIAQLADDVNNTQEPNVLFGWLSSACTNLNCTIMFFLHQNPSTERRMEAKAQGYLGSVGERYASEIWCTEKGKCVDGAEWTFTATRTCARHDAEGCRVKWTRSRGDSITIKPVDEDCIAAEKEAAKVERRKELVQIMSKIFESKNTMRYTDIVKALCRGVVEKESQAKTIVSEAVELGIIRKGDDGPQAEYSLI